MTYMTINLSEYRAFSSVREMDHHAQQHQKSIKPIYFDVYNLLKQHSCVVTGVSYLKNRTIAELSGKSLSTVKDHIKYLIDNFFITKVNTMRVIKGGKGANIYIINSVDRRNELLDEKNRLSQTGYRNASKKDGKTLSQQAMAYVKIKKETIFFKAIKNSFTVTGSRKHKALISRINKIMDFRACPDNVPYDIYMSYSAFLSDKQIATLYSMIVAQTEDCNLTGEEINDIAEYAFKGLLLAMRRHYKDGAAPIKNMFSYTRKIARKKLVEIMDERTCCNNLDLSAAMEKWANTSLPKLHEGLADYVY